MSIRKIKKSNCYFEDGYIFYNDEVVFIDNIIVDKMNHYEKMKQMCDYLDAQPSEQPAPSLDGFCVNDKNNIIPTFNVDTPILDGAIAEAKELMNEIDNLYDCRLADAMVMEDLDLINWINNDYLMINDSVNSMPHRFSVLTMDNPLNVTCDDIADIAQRVVSYKNIFTENVEKFFNSDIPSFEDRMRLGRILDKLSNIAEKDCSHELSDPEIGDN